MRCFEFNNRPANILTSFLYVIKSTGSLQNKNYVTFNDPCGNIDEIKRDLSIVVVKAQFSPTLVNKIKLAPMNFSSPFYYPVLACV